MAVDPDSVGAFTRIADWVLNLLGAVAAAAVAGVGYLYRNLIHRISVLEKTALKKDEFARYEDRADKTREELREGIIALHQKVENSARDLENKLDSLIKHLLERK